MKPIYNKTHKWARNLGLACIGLAALSGCREEINKDDLYTFTGELVGSFLQKNDSIYSQYIDLLKVVPQSKKTNSAVFSLLTTRGNYTCFAPTNQAINEFLQKAFDEGKFASNDFAVLLDSAKAKKHLGDSLAKVIVYNSVINNGNSTAYETAVFPVDNGVFALPNMNDRYLTANTKTEEGKMQYYILDDVKVIYKDIEVENGFVQGVNKVIAPSTSTVADLFKDAKHMQLFGTLMQQTGWIDSMGVSKYLDQQYEDIYLSGNLEAEIPTNMGVSQFGRDALLPEHKKYGFTVFAETDQTLMDKLGMTASDQLIDKLNVFLYEDCRWKDIEGVTFGTSPEDLKRADNAINQFVAYHLLPISIPTNQLVYHFNEKDFDLAEAKKGNVKVTIPVFEFYETMSQAGAPRRLLKIYESQQSGGICLNRKATMNKDNYQEESVEVPGIKVLTKSEEGKPSVTSALNGYIYPIEDILVYTQEETAGKVLHDRLRIDGAALLPELMNLGYRRPYQRYKDNKIWVFFPDDFKLKNISRSPFTKIGYLSGVAPNYGSAWSDYQGDEIMVVGNYDITVKLPPVPVDGTYEIRIGFNANPWRGMCQVYFGEEGQTLSPVDIPLDLRFTDMRALNIGWEEDAEDPKYEEEITKNLRNNKWMKAPRYFNDIAGGPASNAKDVARKILTQEYMEAGKTYYLRFKSALDNTNTEFILDYMDIVPSDIYANPTTPEDWW